MKMRGKIYTRESQPKATFKPNWSVQISGNLKLKALLNILEILVLSQSFNSLVPIISDHHVVKMHFEYFVVYILVAQNFDEYIVLSKYLHRYIKVKNKLRQ